MESNEKKDFRPLVYICSPYSGDTEANTERARRYCRFALDNGQIPLAPHLIYPQFMDEATERDLALFIGIVLMGKCQEVWVCGDTISEGMAAEIDRALKRRQKVRYFNSDFEEVR